MQYTTLKHRTKQQHERQLGNRLHENTALDTNRSDNVIIHYIETPHKTATGATIWQYTTLQHRTTQQQERQVCNTPHSNTALNSNRSDNFAMRHIKTPHYTATGATIAHYTTVNTRRNNAAPASTLTQYTTLKHETKPSSNSKYNNTIHYIKTRDNTKQQTQAQ